MSSGKDPHVTALRAFLEYQRERGLTATHVRALATWSGGDPAAHGGPEGPTRGGVKPANSLRGRGEGTALPLERTQSLSDSCSGSEDQLVALREELGDCQRCKLCAGRTQVVFGVGDAKAQLMFVGEGPGRDEDLQGEPFVGAAGKLLDKMILAMGLVRSQVYIANIVKCRPPQNRDPEPDEVAACEPFLRRQIAIVRPKVIVGLGRYAAQTLLRTETRIMQLRGRWQSYEGTAFMPTLHPAYLLRNPKDKKLVWEDLQAVMRRLGLPLKPVVSSSQDAS